MNGKNSRSILCHRCGNCCHVDMAAYVTAEDMERWEQEGRHDIIAHVHDNDVTWSAGTVTNRFGSIIKTCRIRCVYLVWNGSSAVCAIYETRTKVCRDFVPGSSDLCPQYPCKP